MKKVLILFSVLSLFLTACLSDETIDKKPKKTKDIKLKEDSIVGEDIKILIEDDIYNDFSSELAVDISLELLETFNINKMLGFPEGNLMKVHSVCYDNSVDRAFAVAIMSSTVAVIENNEVIKYIDINISDNKSLKYIACGNGNVFVGSPNSIHKIDGEKLELISEIDSKKLLFPNTMKYFPGVDIFMIPNLDDDSQMFYDGETFELRTSLTLGKVDIFETIDNKLLFVAMKNQSNEKSFFTYYDPKKKKFIGDEYDLDLEGTSWYLTYNPETNELWAASSTKKNSALLVYNLDSKSKDYLNLELKQISNLTYAAGKLIILSENGFDDDTRAGFWGGIQVVDAGTRKTDFVKELAWKHNSVGVDEENMLAYITNNDGGSITVVDLKNGKSSVSNIIRLGTAVEGGVVANDSSVIIRNRLSGSTIIQLSDNDKITELDAGNWPVGVVYDSSFNLAFFYDMLDGAISTLKPGSMKKNQFFQSDLILGNTDAIGDLTYDFTRKILYAITPGLNKIIAIDAENGELIKDIDLVDYTDRYDELSGPAVLTAVVYEPTGKLFAYTARDKVLRVYDSLNDFVLVKEINVSASKGINDFSYALFVDNYNDRVYVGEHIYDALNFEYLGKLKHGSSVVAIDHERGFMLTRGVDKKALEKLYVLDFEGNLIDDLILSDGYDVYARFAYDQDNAYLYAFYLIEGELLKIKLI